MADLDDSLFPSPDKTDEGSKVGSVRLDPQFHGSPGGRVHVAVHQETTHPPDT